MRIAAANYPVERLGWKGLAAKADAWVREAVAEGAELLVFPEYGGVEAALALDEGPGDAAAWCHACARVGVQAVTLWQGLAERHGVTILSGSLPVATPAGLVNRAHLHFPDGSIATQDKQILTPWERANTPLVAGSPLRAVEAGPGRIGVTICYDSEFPLLARVLRPDLLLVPSCTEAVTGLTRVQIGARARAMENQCFSVLATLTGEVPGCDLVDRNTGQAGIYAPPDRGFPEDGIIVEGGLNCAGWVCAELDLAGLPAAREGAEVAIPAHWGEQIRAAERGET